MAVLTSSPLSTAANNIVSLGTRSKGALPKVQREFQDFSRFLDIKRTELEKIELPSQKKVKELANLNIVSTFGSAGNLLTNLFNGALDIGNFISGFFPGRGEKIGKGPSQSKPQPKPQMRGGKLRLGGLRALGIANAVFSGLDFATGLAEGESVGKAGSGAIGSFVGGVGGALAGSLLAGAIGQALIPVPGLGFVLGALGGAAGSFLGGFGADRAYETVTGDTEQKQKEKLKQQEAKQKALAKRVEGGGENFNEVLNRFNQSVIRFESFVINFGNIMGVGEEVYGYSEELSEDEAPKAPDSIDSGPISYGTGNAEFGETGNVSNAKGWVHGHFQGDSPQSVTKDTTMVVKALLKQGSPVYLNQPSGRGIDLSPNKKYTDEEIYNYVEAARKAHTHSGTGKSIDVFVKKGTKVPVPLVNIGPTGGGYGGWGRGGNSGYIQGTNTWIGHLTPDSKSGLTKSVGQIRGKQSPEVNIAEENKQTPQQQIQSQVKPQQQLSSIPTPATAQRTQPQAQMMQLPQSVMAAPSRETPKIQSYPVYSQGQSYIMERETIIAAGSQSRGSNKPVVIPMGGGSNSSVTIVAETGVQVLNSLMKGILLTSLSGT